MKQGWEIKTLGEVCNLQNGFAFRSSDYVKTSNTLNFRMSQIRPGGNIDLENNKRFLPDEYVSRYDDYLLHEGDVVIAMTDMATETKILGVPTIMPKDSRNWLLNQRVGRLYNIDELLINKKYLKYILTSEAVSNYLKSWGRGGLQINIGKKEILNAKIPVPPLKEQQRIVAILDDAFAAIDTALQNTERNLQNAKDLFQSQLNQIFTQKGKDWEEKKLGEVTVKIGSGATPRGGKNSYKKEGISLIRSLNVYDDGFRKEKLAFLDDSQAAKLDNVTIHKKDVLLNITGASVGRVCVVPDNILPARVNQHVSIIRPIEIELNNDFLHYTLIAPENKKRLLRIGEQGATRQAITKSQIENFKIFVPTLKQQQQIVEQLDHLAQHSQQLQQHYQQKINNLQLLKKSLLQQAFNGEL